jgi:hypothetical protein
MCFSGHVVSYNFRKKIFCSAKISFFWRLCKKYFQKEVNISVHTNILVYLCPINLFNIQISTMSPRVRNIVNWVLAGLVGFVFIGSGIMKLMAGEEIVANAVKLGLDAGTFQIIGVVELIAIVLFLIPRTGILGTLLLAAYLGGAMVAHLTHNESVVAPAVVQAFVWIVAVIRFPELLDRFLGKKA